MNIRSSQPRNIMFRVAGGCPAQHPRVLRATPSRVPIDPLLLYFGHFWQGRLTPVCSSSRRTRPESARPLPLVYSGTFEEERASNATWQNA